MLILAEIANRLSRNYQDSRFLKCLDIGLTRFPASVIDLPKYKNYWERLTGLCLFKNKLSQLPSNFLQLRSLRRLNLAENCFTQIPTLLRALPNFLFIDVSNNLICHIPEWIIPGLLIMKFNHDETCASGIYGKKASAEDVLERQQKDMRELTDKMTQLTVKKQ